MGANRPIDPRARRSRPARLAAWLMLTQPATNAAGCDETDPPAESVVSEQAGTDAPTGGADAVSELPCERGTHVLPDGVALHGCDDQVAAVRASTSSAHAFPEVEVSLAAGASMPYQPGKRLNDCEWVTFTDTAKAMMVTCPNGTHVVSGGCMSQRPMLVSSPWEYNVLSNLPEDSERYQDVGDANGWVCIYEGPSPSGQIATALCCD